MSDIYLGVFDISDPGLFIEKKDDGTIDFFLSPCFCSCGNIMWESTIVQDFRQPHHKDWHDISLECPNCPNYQHNIERGAELLALLTWDQIWNNHMTEEHRQAILKRKYIRRQK